MNGHALAILCMEANAFYNGRAEWHRKMSQGVRVCTSIELANSVMAEAFLMRAEELTKA